jgi:hypothetical protein
MAVQRRLRVIERATADLSSFLRRYGDPETTIVRSRLDGAHAIIIGTLTDFPDMLGGTPKRDDAA